jgi:2-dehydro-3-deoxy-D-gluconate 5-dehydrogenase
MTNRPFNLDGRTALITGANTGLGQGIAIALAQAGADIVAAGRREPVDTQAAVLATGRRFHFISADLASTQPIAGMVAETVQKMGRLDILVNNAGMISRAAALDVAEADWDRVMNVDLKSAFFLAQAAARHMTSFGGGKIINVASMLSFQGGIRVPAYTAAKSGLAGVTKALANEWAKACINVNAIAPGYFATDNTQALREDEIRNREIMARIPAGRWGVPADLGGAAVFLASSASDYVHGTIIPVDGGWLAR